MKSCSLSMLALLFGGCVATSKSMSGDPLPEVVLLGEAHGQQRDELRERLEALQPAAVLLEFPRDLFEAPNQPVDEQDLREAVHASVGWQYCQDKKIVCDAFDMQGQDKFNRVTQMQTRFQGFLQRYLDYLEKQRPSQFKALMKNVSAYNQCEAASLQVKNSTQCDLARDQNQHGILQSMRDAQGRGELAGFDDVAVIHQFEEDWNRRNVAMAQNICSFADDFKGRRIVVYVGADHRSPLRQLLKRCPVQLRDPF